MKGSLSKSEKRLPQNLSYQELRILIQVVHISMKVRVQSCNQPLINFVQLVMLNRTVFCFQFHMIFIWL